MYTPRHFLQPDHGLQLDFMRRHSFAALVTTDEAGRPHATHVPVMVEERPEGLGLLFHLACANPQAQQLDGREALCIFSGPHAYISPSLYEQPLSVPTWNYIAVHASGTGQLIRTEAETLAVLEQLILQT
ncbi:MAG: FMN-binding negative transcriptional regulator [Bacteroidia bacterium]|nr:FMN-binding negative transcriptional regulator [Bacteroidia bacterium]